MHDEIHEMSEMAEAPHWADRHLQSTQLFTFPYLFRLQPSSQYTNLPVPPDPFPKLSIKISRKPIGR